MAYVITDREKLQAIWEAAKAGDWPAVYAASVDALTDPNHANQPIQGVDIAVYTWIKGAYGVNSNQGRLPITFVTKPSCSMSCAPGMCPMTGKRASRMPPTTSPKTSPRRCLASI